MYSKGIFEIYNTSVGFPDNDIQSVMTDNRGAIYTSTNKKLIRLFNGQFKSINIPWDAEPLDIISQYIDKNGIYWAGSYGYAFKSQNGLDYVIQRYQSFWKNQHFELTTAIYDLCDDYEGNLLLGTEVGLFKVKGYSISRFITATSKDSGLISNNIQSLLFDNDHKLWIATQEGLSCYYKNACTNYTLQNGLPNLSCYALALDKLGNIWVGTDGGLCRFSKNNNGKYSITSYTLRMDWNQTI